MTQLIITGATVQYLGYKAFVVRGNEPKYGQKNGPGRNVTLRFLDKTPNNWRKVQTVFASACSIVP